MSKSTIVLVIIIFLFSLSVCFAAPSDPSKVKKLKPQRLKTAIDGEFVRVLDVFAISASTSDARVAESPLWFGFLFKETDMSGGKKTNKTWIAVYRSDGSFVAQRPALSNLQNGILCAQVVQNTHTGQLGYFYAVLSESGALQYWFRRTDENGNSIGDPVLIREIPNPQPMADGTVLVDNATLQAVFTQFGFAAVASTNFHESGDNYYGAHSSQVTHFEVAVNGTTNTAYRDEALPNKGKYQEVTVHNLANTDGFRTTYETTTYQKSETLRFPTIKDNHANISVSQMIFEFVGFPPKKIRPIRIAAGEIATTSAFPTMQFLRPEGAGEAWSVFYQYRQINSGPDSNISLYKYKYYIQPLDENNKPDGQPQGVSAPPWKHKVKENPYNSFYRYEEALSDLVPVGGGKYLCLQTRSLVVKTAASPEFYNPRPAAKLQGTEFEANVLLLDRNSMEMTFVTKVKVKGEENDYLANPAVVLSGDSVAFYFERNNTESWSPQGYLIIEPLTTFTNQQPAD